MSFLRLFKEHREVPKVVLTTEHSKMVSKDDLVNGRLVQSYEFSTVSFDSDPRKSLSIFDFSLSNIRKLGRLQDLKDVVLQRNDVDLVIDSLNSIQNERSQAPSEAPQA